MSELEAVMPGYVCAPYLHTHESVGLKEAWARSGNIESLYFVTGTFSGDSRPYFSGPVNHYLLAKFADSSRIHDDLTAYSGDKTSFVFGIRDDLFEREVAGEKNFVSVYYLEYGEEGGDLQEIASLLLKRKKIERAGLGSMRTYCTDPPRFAFPYSDNIVVIEVASEKSHQSVQKYCEQTRSDANRRGLTMTNLLSLSLLERLK